MDGFVEPSRLRGDFSWSLAEPSTLRPGKPDGFGELSRLSLEKPDGFGEQSRLRGRRARGFLGLGGKGRGFLGWGGLARRLGSERREIIFLLNAENMVDHLCHLHSLGLGQGLAEQGMGFGAILGVASLKKIIGQIGAIGD